MTRCFTKAAHGDTTASRFADPLVTYLGTRNQAWVIRESGRIWHLATFLLFCLLLRWPLRFLARFLRGKFRAAWAVVRGAWSGVAVATVRTALVEPSLR